MTLPGVVDLRSDTVTRPTAGMRRAMAEARVGDDALGDDPTVRRLEERVAALLGKEKALFFPSGIMANQTALAVQGRWGGEVVVEAGAHVLNWEDGAGAALSGLQFRPVATPDGVLRPEHLETAVRADSPYLPRTVLVCVENTHLASGGRIVRLDAERALAEAAHTRDLPVHLDGARLWHACVETGLDPATLAGPADTVMVALSKGLGAPVGSMLAGSADLMREAWRVRRRLGGAMRQSGILAAAGLYALDHHLERLAEDHTHARAIAAAFDDLDHIHANRPQTNVVLVDLQPGGPSTAEVLSFLGERGILMLEFAPSCLRAVTHRDVDSRGVERVLDALYAWRAQRGRG